MVRTQDCSLNSFYIKYCAFYNKNGKTRLPQTCLFVGLFASVFLSDVCAQLWLVDAFVWKAEDPMVMYPSKVRKLILEPISK